MKQKLLMFFVLGLLFANFAVAQNKSVTGTVLGVDDKLPIPGASVKIKGTNNAVQTNSEGRYTISVPGSTTVLVFSSLGYEAVERVVGNQSVISVSLASSTNNLSQVVVVAYGTQRKEAITGSIATIGSALNCCKVLLQVLLPLQVTVNQVQELRSVYVVLVHLQLQAAR
jgi:hypothetical protein